MKDVLQYANCVKYALRQKGIVEDDFENTDLRVYSREKADFGTMTRALDKGGIIIAAVDGRLLGMKESEAMAVVLLAVDTLAKTASIYNPVKDSPTSVTMDDFLTAWAASSNRCVTAFANDGTYQPKLLRLDHVELPDDLVGLLEAMAENTHDMWALERQSEGWTYGPQRNDQLLQTPDMVPYGSLTESEKQYDRKMSADTLKLLLALGYKVVKDN